MMHLAIGSNLCWKSRPDCTQAHWKPDEFGSQCFESTCVLRPHYDNIIHKCQYSLYRYLPTFCTHFIKLSAPNSCLCTVSSRTCEYTRDYGGALKPPKPSAQFWAIAQIRRLLKTPTSDINNRTVLACFFSAAVAQVLKPRNFR